MVVIRGVAAAAFAVATIGLYQVQGPAVIAVAQTRVMCERVNEFGDCEQDPPNQQDSGSNCVLVNALDACEDQQEVDNPPHTMDR
ncbi:hypothetical protein ACFWE3_20975 [Mycobacteriaceae bacterium NPDC060252]